MALKKRQSFKSELSKQFLQKKTTKNPPKKPKPNQNKKNPILFM